MNDKINLSRDFVLEQIKDVKYVFEGTLTICIITTTNDFKLVGTSYVFDMAKYDRIKGMEAARSKAEATLFDHCAFYLKTLG